MVKAACVEQGGLITAEASAPVRHDGNPGIDTSALWVTVCSVIAEACSALPASQQPQAVILSAQGDGLWMVDADGVPLDRAYLWNSVEGSSIVTQWEREGVIAEHFEHSGTVLWSGSQAALWRWWSETHPGAASQVKWVMCAKDLISYQLTGEVKTDLTDASIPFLSMATGDYDPKAFERLGCTDLVERVAQIGSAGDVIGVVTPEAASLTGLTVGTPVHLGAIDVAAMVWGQGLGDSGDVMAVLGTTALSAIVSDSAVFSGEPAGATLAMGEGRYLRAMGSSAGAATLEWFMSNVGYQGASRYDLMWEEIESAPAGNEVFLPYLSGERAPFLAPHATGTFAGLTPATTRGSLARAVTEGIAMAMCRGIDRVLGEGQAASNLVLSGGGATATAWARQVANITGRAVTIDQRPNVGALGVAGLVVDIISDGAARSVAEPDHRHEELVARYNHFIDLTDNLMPLWHHHPPQH